MSLLLAVRVLWLRTKRQGTWACVPYNITMTTVGNVSDTVLTKLYKVPLVDEAGKQYLIQYVGMDEITSEVNPVPMSQILPLL